MKNVWYNKNIINKIECCSVDNLQGDATNLLI